MAGPITKETSPAWSGAHLRRLNQQTTALLTQMLSVTGVHSAFVCDNHGEMLGADGPANFPKATYDRIGLQVAQVFAVLEARGNKPKEIEFHFEHRTALAREVGHAFVVILCAPSMDLALLRLALNVAALPFEKDADLQSRLSETAPSRADTLTEKSLDTAAWQLVQTMRLSG